MKYTGIMDKECINLCDAINSIHGLKTSESCCGHGTDPYHIWFSAKRIKDLVVLQKATNWSYGAPDGWHIEADWSENPNYHIIFRLVGTKGKRAYNDAEAIAIRIEEMKGYR